MEASSFPAFSLVCNFVACSSPQVETTMVDARIRKTVKATQAKVGYIRPPTDFNYDHKHLGNGPQTLIKIVEGCHPFCKTIFNAKNPCIIVGGGVLKRKDKDAIFATVETIASYRVAKI